MAPSETLENVLGIFFFFFSHTTEAILFRNDDECNPFNQLTGSMINLENISTTLVNRIESTECMNCERLKLDFYLPECARYLLITVFANFPRQNHVSIRGVRVIGNTRFRNLILTRDH